MLYMMYCDPPSCSMSAPPNSNIGNCGTVGTGGSCNINCHGGYVRSGAARRCSGGSWENGPQSCSPSPCSGGGISNGGPGTCDSSIPHGSSCNHVCNSGYTRSGAARVCSLGVLGGSQSCSPSPCSGAAIPNGGKGTCDNSIPHNTYCKHSCNTGYSLFGADRKCSFGVLGGGQECRPNPCPVSAPTDGNLGTCPASLPSGQSCSLACMQGPTYWFTRAGSASLSCFAGTLTGASTCTPNTCPLATPRNGNRGNCGASPIQSGSAAPGFTCDLGCNAGFRRFGTSYSCYAQHITNSQPQVCKSTNADLSLMQITETLTAAFSRNQLAYSVVDMPWNANTLKISGRLDYPPAGSEFGGAQLAYNRAGGGFTAILSDQWTADLPIPIIPGTTPVSMRVISESGDVTKTYTINVHRLSHDAQLVPLTISPPGVSAPVPPMWYTPSSILRPWAPVWHTNTTAYTVAFAWAQTTVRVQGVYGYPLANGRFLAPRAASWTPLASATWSAPLSLDVGDNRLQWLQTSEDELHSKTYIVDIHRISNDPTMAAVAVLPVGTGLSPAFSRTVGSYSMTVLASTTHVTLTATQSYALGSTYSGFGGQTTQTVAALSWTPLLDGATSQLYPVAVGDNWVGIKGVAEDSTSVQYYLFKVHRLSSDATLAALSCSAGALTPAFSPTTLLYSISVPSSVTSCYVVCLLLDRTSAKVRCEAIGLIQMKSERRVEGTLAR